MTDVQYQKLSNLISAWACIILSSVSTSIWLEAAMLLVGIVHFFLFFKLVWTEGP